MDKDVRGKGGLRRYFQSCSSSSSSYRRPIMACLRHLRALRPTEFQRILADHFQSGATLVTTYGNAFVDILFLHVDIAIATDK
jgi:hypothetical protein